MVVWRASHIVKEAHLATSALIVSVFSLSACAVATPATITSTTPPPQRIASVNLIGKTGETGLRAKLGSELTRALTAAGVPQQNGADHLADFAVSERSVATGLLPVSKNAEAAGLPEPDFKSRWYDKCKPNRVSASLVVYARASGTITSKASGEFLACPGDHSQLSDLADLLVERALTQ